MVRSGQSITKEFTLRQLGAGASDADTLPTGTLYKNGTANGASVTVTNQATGKYKAAVTLPTLANGDLVELMISATVDSVADNCIIWHDDCVADSDIQLAGATSTTITFPATDNYGVPIPDNDQYEYYRLQEVTPAGLGRIVKTTTGAAGARVYNLSATASPAFDATTKFIILGPYAVEDDVTAIKAKTDNLPSDPADASDIAASFSTVNSSLATIAAYIDTEVASILAAVDTEVAAIKAKTDNLPSDPADASDVAALIASLSTAISTVNSLVTAIKTKTDSLTFTATGKVDARIARIGSSDVQGAGILGNNWRPV